MKNRYRYRDRRNMTLGDEKLDGRGYCVKEARASYGTGPLDTDSELDFL